MGRRARARRQLRATNYQTSVLHTDNLRREQALGGGHDTGTPGPPDTPDRVESAWSTRTTVLVATGITVMVVAVMAAVALTTGDNGTEAKTHTITGSVVLTEPYGDVGAQACTGQSVFGDTDPAIVVTGPDGAVLGRSALDLSGEVRQGDGGCELGFTVSGMESAAAYKVAVGPMSKTYTRAELEQSGWSVEFEKPR